MLRSCDAKPSPIQLHITEPVDGARLFVSVTEIYREIFKISCGKLRLKFVCVGIEIRVQHEALNIRACDLTIIALFETQNVIMHAVCCCLEENVESTLKKFLPEIKAFWFPVTTLSKIEKVFPSRDGLRK